MRRDILRSFLSPNAFIQGKGQLVDFLNKGYTQLLNNSNFSTDINNLFNELYSIEKSDEDKLQICLEETIDLYNHYFNDNSFPIQEWMKYTTIDENHIRAILANSSTKRRIEFYFSHVNFLLSQYYKPNGHLIDNKYLYQIFNFWHFLYNKDSELNYLIENIKNSNKYKEKILLSALEKEKNTSSLYSHFLLAHFYNHKKIINYFHKKCSNNEFKNSLIEEQKRFFAQQNSPLFFKLFVNKKRLEDARDNMRQLFTDTLLYKNLVDNSNIKVFLSNTEKDQQNIFEGLSENYELNQSIILNFFQLSIIYFRQFNNYSPTIAEIEKIILSKQLPAIDFKKEINKI